MDPNSPADPSFAAPQPPYIAAEAVGPPSAGPRHRFGWLGSVLLVLILLALGGSFLLNVLLLAWNLPLESDRRVREKFFSHQRTASDKVAILSIKGVIVGSENGFVKRQIEQATKDTAVKAVVLRVDSPGGTVSGADYYYHHLRKLVEKRGIPMVVSMGSVAASGGYYVAMAAGATPDILYAEPATWTGSIGVIIPHYNFGELMGKLGIAEDPVTSGPLKDMGSVARPMTEEERRIFRSLVDSSFVRFKDIIKQGRSKFQDDPEALDKVATGQVFSAAQARQNGLIDQIGYLEEAVDRAIALAGLDAENVRVVKYEREFGLFDALCGLDAQHQGPGLSALLELSSPRAYYLSTRLPVLLSSER